MSHVFSDKTGTLTANHMEFRRLLIDGASFGVGETAISKSLRELAAAHATGRDYANAMEVQPSDVSVAVTEGSPELRSEPLPPWAGCREATAKKTHDLFPWFWPGLVPHIFRCRVCL